MEIGGVRWFFFREENIVVLEARFIWCAVRNAESRCPSARLLILSDALALVRALCKGRSNKFTLLSVMRRIFASCVRAGFVLSFRRILSELNCSDKGSRVFDSDYDPSKSLLHDLAQRLTQSSLAQTSDQDCLSSSLMQLDVGEVDFTTSHIHVPAVSVQSPISSDVLCNCTGHVEAVSSHRSSVAGPGWIAI